MSAAAPVRTTVRHRRRRAADARRSTPPRHSSTSSGTQADVFARASDSIEANIELFRPGETYRHRLAFRLTTDAPEAP